MSDRYTEEMIELALRWAPFGGVPNDEALVGFGVSAPAFYRQMEESISSGGAAQLSTEDAERLQRSCVAVKNARRSHAEQTHIPA